MPKKNRRSSALLKEPSVAYETAMPTDARANDFIHNLHLQFVTNAAGIQTAVVIPISEWQRLVRAYQALLRRYSTTTEEITFWSDAEIDYLGEILPFSHDENEEDTGEWFEKSI